MESFPGEVSSSRSLVSLQALVVGVPILATSLAYPYVHTSTSGTGAKKGTELFFGVQPSELLTLAHPLCIA